MLFPTSQLLVQQIHFRSECRSHFSQPTRNVTAGVDHGQEHNRLGPYVAHKEVYVHTIETQIPIEKRYHTARFLSIFAINQASSGPHRNRPSVDVGARAVATLDYWLDLSQTQHR